MSGDDNPTVRDFARMHRGTPPPSSVQDSLIPLESLPPREEVAQTEFPFPLEPDLRGPWPSLVDEAYLAGRKGDAFLDAGLLHPWIGWFAPAGYCPDCGGIGLPCRGPHGAD